MRRIFQLVILGLVVWLFTSRGNAAEEGPAEAHRLRARELYQAGDYAGVAKEAAAGLALLPEEGGDPKVRAGLWQWAGVGAEALGDFAAARTHLEKALALYRTAGARREVGATLNSLAAVHDRQGNREAQLAVLIEAHAIFEELGEVRGRAALANSLGNYFSAVKEPAKALPYHEQSVALRRTLNDPTFLAAGLENLGITLRESGRDRDARVAYEEALGIYRAANDEEGLAGVLTNLGSLAADESRFEQALGYYEEALKYDRAAGYKPGEAILLRNIGATLRRAGREAEALRWLDDAVALANELGDAERITSAYEERSAALEAADKPKEALADLRAAMTQRAKQETEARRDALLDLQTRFETVQKEREIERLQRVGVERELGLTRSEAAREAAEQARAVEQAQRRTAWAMAAGAGMAALVLGILFQVKRRAARRIARQRSELAHALDELRTVNAELKRLYARKSEWLGFAAHDLRSPLFAIDGLCAEVAAGLADSPAQTVADIRQAASRMRMELDAWLEAERREQADIVLKLADTDLGALAAEVVEANQPAARAKKLQLTYQATGVTWARVDPWRWREVLENLVSNAIKFSPPGKIVTVLTGAAGGQVWCRVRDEGPGLTVADRARLFAAFVRLSARPTGGESSTGIGLNLVKRLVDAHGGEILVTSEPGHGAVFEVRVAALNPREAKRD